MNPPSHHPTEDVLLAYAAGGATEAQSLLVATHLTYCPICRAQVRAFEDLGGMQLMENELHTVGPALLERTLSRLGEKLDPPEPAPPTSSLPEGAAWPTSLQPYLRGLRWRRAVPGVERIELPINWDGEPVRVFRLRPGFTVPRHTHGGDEYQLVLQGGLWDLGEHFVVGDVATRDSSHVHELKIDKDEPCITLNVLSAPLVPKTLLGRIIGLLAGV